MALKEDLETLLNYKHGMKPRLHQDHQFPLGAHVETTGETFFRGTVIGHYVTLEGHKGVVIQIDPTESAARVVHVNRCKYIRLVGE